MLATTQRDPAEQSASSRHGPAGSSSHPLCTPSKSGAGALRPRPFGRLASRAAVLKRILPSRISGGTGSDAVVATGSPTTSGTQLRLAMHGPPPSGQSPSSVQLPPPGWPQNPPPAQSSSDWQGRSTSAAQRKSTVGPDPVQSGSPPFAATATTFRAR